MITERHQSSEVYEPEEFLGVLADAAEWLPPFALNVRIVSEKIDYTGNWRVTVSFDAVSFEDESPVL